MPQKKNIVNFLLAQELLKTVAGDSAIDLVKIYERRGRPVTDEEVAKIIGTKVTEIRTILNRLHYRGIACYHKTKNKKTGWYSYTWDIKIKRIAELLLEQHLERIKKLETREQLEKNYVFFNCKNNCENFPFEVAAEYQFKCPVCGGVMESTDNQKAIKQIKSEIKTIKSEVEELKKIV